MDGSKRSALLHERFGRGRRSREESETCRDSGTADSAPLCSVGRRGTSGGWVGRPSCRPGAALQGLFASTWIAHDLPGRSKRLGVEVPVVDLAVGIQRAKPEVLLALAVGR